MTTSNPHSTSIFNWETDNLLAEDRTPEPRKRIPGGVLIAAAIFVAFILTVALAGSCGSGDADSQPKTQTGSRREAPATTAAASASTTTTSTTQAPQPECAGDKEPVYTQRTNTWRCQFPTLRCGTGEKRVVDGDTQRCRPMTAEEKLAAKCSGSPYRTMNGKRSNAIDGKCIVLVCDTPKDRSGYYATTYSCGGEWYDDGTGFWHDSHPSVRPYREVLGWEEASIVKRELAKLGWTDCSHGFYTATSTVTEYDGILFACS